MILLIHNMFRTELFFYVRTALVDFAIGRLFCINIILFVQASTRKTSQAINVFDNYYIMYEYFSALRAERICNENNEM